MALDVLADRERLPVRQRDGVHVLAPRRQAGLDDAALAAQRDPLHLVQRPAGRVRAQQLDERLFPLAEHHHVEGARAQHVVGHRGAVLAAQHHQRVGKFLAYGVGHAVGERPQRAEHAGEADHRGVGLDARDDLVEGQPLHHEVAAVRVRRDRVERFAGGVDHAVGQPGLLERAGDVGQSQRRVRRVHLQPGERLDARGVDEGNHARSQRYYSSG